MPTVKDVARRAGVSMITVSRVVNGSDKVGEKTRQKVEEAIRELNYVPNMVASSLRSSQSDLLALVLPDITNTFWTSIARGVEDEAWSRGYGVFICNTDNDLAKEEAYIESLLRRRVGGVLCVPTPDPASQQQFQRLRSHGISFVVIHRPLEGIEADVVRTDGEGAAHALTTELVRLGRKRIAYVGMPLSDKVSADRLEGYNRALHDAGIPANPELVMCGGMDKETGAYNMVHESLWWSERPDAYLLGNARIAVGGVHALLDAGLRLQEDVGVAAFHDISALDHYASRLIRAVQPSREMGRQATQRLFEIAAGGGHEYHDVVLSSQIILPTGIPAPRIVN